jgi:hypothetical protein
MSTRNGTLERAAFKYDIDHDLYTCPGGKELRRGWQKNRVHKEGPAPSNGHYYRARKRDCKICPLLSRCCLPTEDVRKIFRSVHEGARDMAHDIANSEAYLVSKRERKKIEMLFAHLKRILKLNRLRLRGPNGAKDEFLLAATAQNLRKLAKIIPMPAVPAPA